MEGSENTDPGPPAQRVSTHPCGTLGTWWYSLESRGESKAGAAEQCEELGNEEQNHLVQSLLQVPRALCAPGRERAMGLSLWNASCSGIRGGSGLGADSPAGAAHRCRLDCAFLTGQLPRSLPRALRAAAEGSVGLPRPGGEAAATPDREEATQEAT